MPIDFSGISNESLFGKRREVYRLKAHKLDGLVDCALCKLIFDYTKSCSHLGMESGDMRQVELDLVVNSDSEEKLVALAKVARSLDILSTARVSSLMLKK